MDRHILALAEARGVSLAGRCTDAEFLRRATLDVTGTLPTPDEVRAFLADGSPDKRPRLVEDLLARDAYSLRWANWLAELSGLRASNAAAVRGAANGSKLAPEDLARFWIQWLRVRVANDTPYHEIVAGQLLATSREGRSFEEFQQLQQRVRQAIEVGGDAAAAVYAERATNDLFWMVHLRDAANIPATVSNCFMGVKLECARCHDHPDGHWTRQDFRQFGAIFQRLAWRTPPRLDRDEKKRHASGAYVAGCVAAPAYVGIAIGLLRSRWHKMAAASFIVLGAATAGALYVATGYLHVFSRSPNRLPFSPGIALANAFYLPNGQQSAGFVPAAIALGVVCAAIGLVCVVAAVRVWRGGPRRATLLFTAAAALAAAATLTLADAVYAGGQKLLHSREPLVNWLRRDIQDRLRPGEARVQEVFLAEEYERDPDTARLFDGTVVADHLDTDPRRALVHWLSRPDVPYLSGHIVNRVWAEYFGRGLVESLDDNGRPRPHGPLLDELAEQLRQHDWSLRFLHRTILLSDTYQQTSQVPDAGQRDPLFARFVPRPLSGRQLIQAIDDVTATQSDFGPGKTPDVYSVYHVAGQHPAGKTSTARAARILCTDPDADQELRLDAATYLLVEPGLTQKFSDRRGRLARLLRSGATEDQMLDDLYLACYARVPGDGERTRLLSHVAQCQSNEHGWQDVIWALINSREFQFVY